MKFNFSGKISLNDYIQYNRFIYKKLDKMIYVIVFIFVIINFSINLKKYFENKRMNLEYIKQIQNFSEENINVFSSNIDLFFTVILPTILFIVFFLIFVFIIEKCFMPIRYKKYYNSYKTLCELTNYKITNENILISSESGNTILTKEKIYKILYDKDTIYICIGLNMAYIIKKHYFEKNDEFDELRIFLNENYKNKK